MDGCYRRLFTIADIAAIVERIRESLKIAESQRVYSLLGFESFEVLGKQAGKPGPGPLLNAIFDLCAEHRLSREYILLGRKTQAAIHGR